MEMKKIWAIVVLGMFLSATLIVPAVVPNQNANVNDSNVVFSDNAAYIGEQEAISNYLNSFKKDVDYGDTDLVQKHETKPISPEYTEDGDKIYYVSYDKVNAVNDGFTVLANNTDLINVAYPGAILIGNKLLADNTPTSLSLNRSDMQYSISLQLDDTTFTANPTAVNGAINNKVSQWVASGKPISADFTYKSTLASSGRQLITDLGLTSEDLKKLQMDINWVSTKNTTTYVVQYTQIYYTVTATLDHSGDAGRYFGENATLAQVKNAGIGAHNMPVIVKSVSYGRTITASVTAESSNEKTKIALEAAIKGQIGTMSAEMQDIARSAKLQVYMSGGPMPKKTPSTIMDVQKIIEDCGNITPSDFQTAKPVSYSTSWINDGNRASCSLTSEYNKKTVLESSTIKISVKFTGAFVGKCIISYKSFEKIEGGKYVNSADKKWEKKMIARNTYIGTIDAKHQPYMYLTLMSDTKNILISDLKIIPTSSINIEYWGGICHQHTKITVDGKIIFNT